MSQAVLPEPPHVSRDPAASSPAGRRRAWLGAVAWILSALLLLGALGGLFVRFHSESAGSNVANALVKGERPVAPALPKRDLADDGAPGLPGWYHTGSAQSQRGNAGTGRHILVVNFWASWCGPCQQEAPLLREVSHDYAGDGITVVGVDASSEDLAVDARAFVREHRLDFPIVLGRRADKDRWGVAGYPETFVVGVDGHVSAHVNGPLDEAELRQLLDRELART